MIWNLEFEICSLVWYGFSRTFLVLLFRESGITKLSESHGKRQVHARINGTAIMPPEITKKRIFAGISSH